MVSSDSRWVVFVQCVRVVKSRLALLSILPHVQYIHTEN